MELKGIVRVNYIGEQNDGQGGAFSLYNLLEDMGEYPLGSTLSESTIFKAGFAFTVANIYDEGEIPC